MGPPGVLVAAMRVPSGERDVSQRSSFGPRAKLMSSEPLPLKGSRVVMISCLRSSVGSAIAHSSDGDLAQVIRLQGLAVNNGCDSPPPIETRMTGWGVVAGGAPVSSA